MSSASCGRSLLKTSMDLSKLLLLQKVSTRRLGGFFFQGEMHPFMAAVLLRMSRLDPFDADS